MSIPTPSPINAANEFKAHFGAAPGVQDPTIECANWQRLCETLLAERTVLQTQLEAARADAESHLKSLEALACKSFKLDLTMGQVYSLVDKETSLAQLIAELEHEAQAGKA
jgi:hypothetical protein